MKININNAAAIINEMINGMGYELKRTAAGDRYYEMTEKDFDKVVSDLFANSTKTFAEAAAKQTEKITIAWLNNAKGARIATYKYNFAFIKFID